MTWPRQSMAEGHRHAVVDQKVGCPNRRTNSSAGGSPGSVHRACSPSWAPAARSSPGDRRSNGVSDDYGDVTERTAAAGDRGGGLLTLYETALPHVYGYLLSRCGRVALAANRRPSFPCTGWTMWPLPWRGSERWADRRPSPSASRTACRRRAVTTRGPASTWARCDRADKGGGAAPWRQAHGSARDPARSPGQRAVLPALRRSSAFVTRRARARPACPADPLRVFPLVAVRETGEGLTGGLVGGQRTPCAPASPARG